MPKDVKKFALELADAFSTDNYSNGWSASIKMLRKHCLNDREIEAIIRSKWTRWACDQAGKAYGRHTSRDLERFLFKEDGQLNTRNLGCDLATLVRETFWYDDMTEGSRA